MPKKKQSKDLATRVAENTKAMTTGGGGKDPIASLVTKLERKIPDLNRMKCDGARLQRIFVTQIRTKPDLLEAAAANPISAVSCLMKIGEWGLDPSILNECYIIRYNIDRKPTLVPQQGYKGLMKLARRGGKDLGILYEVLDAREVCANDRFVVQFGADPKLEHEINPLAPRGEVLGYYAVAVPKGGKPISEFLTVAEVKKHKKRFSRATKGPLADEDNFDRYGCKTVMRLLCTRRLDLSPTATKQILEDINAEKGERIEDVEIDVTPQALLPAPEDDPDFAEVEEAAPKKKAKQNPKAFDEIKGYQFTSGPVEGETVEDVAAGYGVGALEAIVNNPEAYSSIDREFAERAAEALGPNT